MKSFLALAILLLLNPAIFARVFTRCELALELKNQGLPVELLPDWVCLVESESSRNSAIVGGPNVGGSYDWGLYQVNDKFWCVPGVPGGSCKVKCESMVTDDITMATNCAKYIYSIQGFGAWNGWKSKCQENLPDLSECGV